MRQQLVINGKIEKTVIVGSHEEGDRITRNSYPHNVTSIFSKDCYSFGQYGGGLATSSLNEYRGTPRLTADYEQLLRYFYIN